MIVVGELFAQWLVKSYFCDWDNSDMRQNRTEYFISGVDGDDTKRIWRWITSVTNPLEKSRSTKKLLSVATESKTIELVSNLVN